jgi:Flp pilus assembly protein TadD
VQLGRNEEALRSFDRAIASNPFSAEALYNRAVALHKLGRDAEARQSLKKALAVRENYPEARRLLDELG